MERQSEFPRIVAVSYDLDLERFLRGDIGEPEERVTREGVPDYRPEHRKPRSVSAIVRSLKPKLFARARIQLKVDKFKYFPISGDQIRLLRIKPGRPDEQLVCDLSIHSLAEVKGRYEALSYCWGTEDPSEVIQIRKLFLHQGTVNPSIFSHGPPEDFPIRPNLYHALLHLRSRETYVIVWIDAICIDQKDTAEAKREKDRQLSMMNEIYNSANNVCIWLGDADEKSRDALNLVREIMNFRTFDIRLEPRDEEAKQRFKQQWCHFLDSLKAPWFSRRWIIQEVALARRASVHFGDDVVHWDDLADAISLLNEKAETLKRQFGSESFAEVPILSATHLVKAIVNVCRKSQDGQIIEKLLDLETLVSTFQQFQATYSEDIIHSVRSLAKDAPHQDEDKDFRTTAEHKQSTRDLFIAFVNRCIKNSNSLDIICRHWAPPPTDTAGEEIELPSWVSELSKCPFGIPGEFRERQNGENFVAMSATDKRKRYSASLGYDAFNAPDRPSRSSIVATMRLFPANSISEPHTSSDVQKQIIAGADLMLSPLASPMTEKSSYFAPPLKPNSGKPPAGQISNDTSADRRTQKISLPKLDTNGIRPSPSMNPSPLLVQAISNTRKNRKPTPPDTSLQDISPTTTTPQTANSLTLAPNPRKRAASIETPREVTIQPGSSTATSSRRNTRRDSKQPKRRYTQEDKEHIESLSGILEVHGFILGTVKRHSDVMRDGIVPGDWLKKLGWDRNSKENRVPDIIWRTLVADRSPEGGNPPGWYQRACLHCLRDTRISDSKGNLRSSRGSETSEMTAMFLKRVESVIWNRRIMEIESKVCSTNPLFGLAPEVTAARDIVCILFGCSVPVVLRKVEEHSGDNELYELIGEAYVHGKMDGEAVQDKKLVRDVRRQFFLR
ncbi:HET-domain-containing protein [Zopfia rhizophila CBS 207.26]|uniref:HET-domain-containing protein n=1 Tax=Zopfia rhizophila CBS 207.26 TaxID=1314779 RepID=A0A6A6EW37_9PEZI|nr:HET-domain-containing protein [Zopfia rhizophila CBS 207.26]